MKAQELRIGNWVHHKPIYSYRNRDEEEFDFQIELDDFVETDTGRFSFDLAIEGIPLAEEWLLKFGFKKKPLYVWNGNARDWQPDTNRTEIQDYVLDNCFTVRFEKWGYKSKEDGEWKFDDSVKIILGEWYERCSETIIYLRANEVHCLQNVYFEMEAKELTINESTEQELFK